MVNIKDVCEMLNVQGLEMLLLNLRAERKLSNFYRIWIVKKELKKRYKND